MRFLPVVLGGGLTCAVAVAAATGQATPAATPAPDAATQAGQFRTEVEVIARTVAVDVVDAKGRPVEAVPAGGVRVFEDGVERQVLDVRPLAPLLPAAVAPAVAPGAPPAARPPSIVQSHVLVALDPVTLGPRDWREAAEALAAAADTLVAIGPVDVVALTAPLHRAVSASRDAAAVRAALAEVRESVPASDAFYGGRTRLLRDAQERRGAFQDVGGGAGATLGGRSGAAVAGAAAAQAAVLRSAAFELAADEERMLRNTLDRVAEALDALPRPSVLVWVAGGDPMPGEFFARLLPESFPPGDLAAILAAGQATTFWNRLDELWQAWAREGVRVVAWTPARVRWTEIGSAEARGLLRNDLPIALAEQEVALFEGAAAKTGGALALTGAELPQALASVAGRFEVTYQSDRAAPGWHDLRVEAATAGWRVHAPLRILVPSRAAAPPLVLAVELRPERTGGAAGGREAVRLPVLVDLDPLRSVLPPDTPLRFVVRIIATPPGGRPVGRDVEVRLPRLPAEGWLRYETTLTVPRGTAAYAVEVREETTGAVGGAGPADAVGAEPGEGAAAAAAAAGVAPAAGGAASPRFAETAEVRVGQARFLMPEDAPADGAGVRVVWNGAEQKLLRVAGGPGSPLELGIAVDVSESVAAERAAFARAAAAAAARLVGPEDRVFRVDFGATPRFKGAVKGSAATLFADVPDGRPEATAIFDGLKYALERFEGVGDRLALVVFTDGCETTGRTTWQEVARTARSRAVPVFVVVADGALCTKSIRYRDKGVLEEAGVLNPGWVTGSTNDVSLSQGSRWGLGEVARASGGRVVSLATAAGAGGAWADVERALARLWVALFEPSSPALDPRQVEVRLGRDRLLRPAA